MGSPPVLSVIRRSPITCQLHYLQSIFVSFDRFRIHKRSHVELSRHSIKREYLAAFCLDLLSSGIIQWTLCEGILS